MLFHLGGIIRLNEIGHLQKIARVSSVSGGSITAGVLGLAWQQLEFGIGGIASNLDELVVEPIRKLAGKTIDNPAIIWGLLLPWRTAPGMLASYYDRYLFHGATLQELPDDAAGEGPRFVFNATNVQTGKLFRFSRPYQGDYSVGLWRDPSTRVADAVAASTAIPPTLSPYTPKPSGTFDESTEGSNKEEIFRRKLWLTDGGVYDNLGLETAWKRYRTLLVSDAGAPLEVDPEPHRNWIQHAIWVSDIVDDQVRALASVSSSTATSARSDRLVLGHPLRRRELRARRPLPFPRERVERAQGVPTRFAALDATTQTDLIDWGYVIADTSLRRWVYPLVPRPLRLPATEG